MESFDKAFAGCDVVVHLAAGTSGSEKDSQTGTLQGTRNLLELCRRHKPQRLIYVSSCSVYGVAELRKGTVVTEQAALERFADRRGSYSATKQEAEGYVSEYMNTGVPTVILRPGTIYGPGTDLYTPMLGFSAGHRYIVIGDGSFVLPFVYVENLVDAIVACERSQDAVGQVFNVVDPEPLTKRRYMEEVICKVDPMAKVSFFPYFALRAVVWFQELLFAAMRRPAILTRYRLASSQNSVTYDSSSIRTRLGWTPPVQQKDAFERLVNAELRKQDGLSGDRTTAGDSRAA
jgi:nucleoside-diphosphate-sugar epimerase